LIFSYQPIIIRVVIK